MKINNKLEEKPEHRFFINAGVYVISPEILDSIPKNKFYNMTDVITPLLNQKKVVSFPIHEYWIDVGQPEHLELAASSYEPKY